MGNSNTSKPTPPSSKNTCTFCRKESCRGDSCQSFYRETAGYISRGSGASVGYVSSHSSLDAVPVGRSTSSSLQKTYIGTHTPSAGTQSGSIGHPAYTAAATTQSGSIGRPGTYTTSATTQSGSIGRPGTYAASATTQSGSIGRPAYTAAATTQSGSIGRPGTYTASATTQSGSIGCPGTSTAAATTQSGIIGRPGTSTAAATTQSAGSIGHPGYGPRTCNVSQSGSTLQPITTSHSGTRISASTLPSSTYGLISGNQAPESNKTGHGTNVPSNLNQSKPLSNPSNVSKPLSEVGAFKSTPNKENVLPPQKVMQEQALQRNLGSNGQSPSSTKGNSNNSLLSDILLPTPYAGKKFQESGVNATTHIKSTNCEVGYTKAGLSALDLKWLETPDTGAKSLITKPSSCASIISKNSSNAELVDETSARQPKFKHSPNAVKYEGIVFEIIGSRNAKVRVAERNGVPVQKSEWGAADAVHKYALLVVDKLMNDGSGAFHPSKTPICNVLRKGDILGLICTAHNNPSSGFQLYAHEAWHTGEQGQVNDADSVASVYSKSGSDTQESASSKAKTKRQRSRKNPSKKVADGDGSDVSNAVNQWLDSNQYCLNKNENSKPLKLIGGCHYIGKVIEVRPPYGFIVEISSKEGKQFVFVVSNYFYPLGISAPALSDGTSLKSTITIGDEIVVIPIKNVAMQEGKFEWVASKAWPKNIQSAASSDLNNSSQGGQLIGPEERVNQPKDTAAKKAEQRGEAPSGTYIKSLYPSVKNWIEFDGEILTLQYNWGLVKEKVNNQAAYVFTRDNTYLFGAGLQHFILDDVLKIGQQVKFALDTEEPGAMTALAVWLGNKLPNYNAFDIAINKYCEENGVKLATEDSLIQHGKAIYLGH